MEKSIFALSGELSGINDYLFDHLRSCGWRVRVATVGAPSLRGRVLGALAFHPNRAVWRQRYHAALERFLKSAPGARWRCEESARIVAAGAAPGDLLFQIGGLFLIPSVVPVTRPYFVFKDYTVALARRTDPKSLPIQNADWLDRLQSFEASSCSRAAVVFTASENTRHSIVEDYKVPPERVVAVGEGVKLHHLPPPANSAPTMDGHSTSRRILFVGKDFRRKGGALLLEAFRRLRTSIPDAQLTIVGPNTAPPCEDGVEWLGQIHDRERLADLYRSATVFAMPSQSEPFGLVFLEAMAYSLPCVGTWVDAMPEIIVDGVTGYVVPPQDAGALASRLAHLLENPAAASAMGRRGYERVKDQYQWCHVAQRIDARLAREFP